MTIPKDEYKVTVYLNNALAQGGAFHRYANIQAPSEIKALIIAREQFKKIDYEYMSVVKTSRIIGASMPEDVYLWDVDKIQELKE